MQAGGVHCRFTSPSAVCTLSPLRQSCLDLADYCTRLSMVRAHILLLSAFPVSSNACACDGSYGSCSQRILCTTARGWLGAEDGACTVRSAWHGCSLFQPSLVSLQTQRPCCRRGMMLGCLLARQKFLSIPAAGRVGSSDFVDGET